MSARITHMHLLPVAWVLSVACMLPVAIVALVITAVRRPVPSVPLVAALSCQSMRTTPVNTLSRGKGLRLRKRWHCC